MTTAGCGLLYTMSIEASSEHAFRVAKKILLVSRNSGFKIASCISKFPGLFLETKKDRLKGDD